MHLAEKEISFSSQNDNLNVKKNTEKSHIEMIGQKVRSRKARRYLRNYLKNKEIKILSILWKQHKTSILLFAQRISSKKWYFWVTARTDQNLNGKIPFQVGSFGFVVRHFVLFQQEIVMLDLAWCQTELPLHFHCPFSARDYRYEWIFHSCSSSYLVH